MFRLLRKIVGAKSYPLNRIAISSEKLLANLQFLQTIDPAIKIAPILKSNAYGHGIELVGQVLEQIQDDQKPPFLCVDSLFEAYQLQKTGVKIPILVMGYVDPKNLTRKQLPFEYAVFDLDFAKALNVYQPGARVHVFVDTGMNREGVTVKDLPGFLKTLQQYHNLTVVGLLSHLASADEKDNPQNGDQINNFKKAKQIISKYFPEISYFHLGGSYGLLNQHLNKTANVIRVGKALFGVLNTEFRTKNRSSDDLKPVLSMYTKIVQIKDIGPKQRIGYSGSFVTKKPTVLAVLPIGYHDGVDLRLSSKGIVRVKNQQKDGLKKWVECPIIGRVSMNITTIDITAVDNPFLGQMVEVFSSQPKDRNSIEKAAEICQTIPYDLLVRLNPTTRREIID